MFLIGVCVPLTWLQLETWTISSCGIKQAHVGKEYAIPCGEAVLMQKFIAIPPRSSTAPWVTRKRYGRRKKKRLALWVSSLSGSKVSEWSAGPRRTQETEMWTVFLQILFFQQPRVRISFARMKLWHQGHLRDWARGWLQGEMDQIHTTSIHNFYSLNYLNT